MKKLNLAILLFVVTSLFMMSCSDYKTNPNGLKYRFFEENKGDTPQVGDLIDFNVSCSVNDTMNVPMQNSQIRKLIEPLFAGDIYEGLAMMHRGDSAAFVVNIDSTYKTFFRRSVPENVSSNDVMKFNVKMNDFYPESEYANKMVEKTKRNNPEEVVKADKEIMEYLAANNIVAEPTESGLYYVATEPGNGERPTSDQIVSINFTLYLLDSVNTKLDSSFDWGEPFEVPLGAGYVFPGWEEGLKLMSKGEKGEIYVPFYLGLGERASGPIPAFSNIKLEVELIDFYTQAEKIKKTIDNTKSQHPEEVAKSEQEIKDYFTENNIVAEPTETGLYYVVTEPGNGEKPTAGQTVKVHYNGTLFDGTKFDSSYDRDEPIEFPLGKGMVIPGWDEGIQLMSKGEKGVLYIPFYLAYGERATGPIPAFANLKFEVELIDFK